MQESALALDLEDVILSSVKFNKSAYSRMWALQWARREFLWSCASLWHLRTVAHWTLRKAQFEFWNEKQTLFWLCLWELLKSKLRSMKNRYLIFKFYCHKCLLLIMLSLLQKIEQRCKIVTLLWLIFYFSWVRIIKKKKWKICSWKAFLQFHYCHKKSFPFFLQVFLSSLGVLVSISKGQVSARTIKSLRLESTHKSGKLICMSKIICSQTDIQSKWLKELLAVKDVSWRGKEWKQTRSLGRKIKAVLFEPLPAGSHADLGRF